MMRLVLIPLMLAAVPAKRSALVASEASDSPKAKRAVKWSKAGGGSGAKRVRGAAGPH